MPYWSWIVLGMFLLGAEIVAVDAAFYLIFIGAAAIVVGVVEMFGVGLPVWGQFALFAGVAAVSMVLFRERLYTKLRGGVAGFEDEVTGNTVRVDTALEPGATTRVHHRGSTWTAENVGHDTIPAGAEAAILSVDGLKLNVSVAKS